MMHSVRGGLGQTFALAKHNESEGRKTRIRRSKEERKAMVESFIKKYQHSNNGNFPSLNLTHKEVGGSFYTVREIVRDIIQENRVLGPAKFTLEELNTDTFFEQNPLGSIARVPEPFSTASSIENHCELEKVQDTNKTMISVSDESYTEVVDQVVDKGHVISFGHMDVTDKEPIEVVVADGRDTRAENQVVDQGHTMNVSHIGVTNNESVETSVVFDECCTGNEYKFVDNGHVLNDSQVNIVSEESNEIAILEMQLSDSSSTLKQKVEQELAAANTPMTKVNAATEDLIVETFPLTPGSMTTDGIRSPEGLMDSRNSPETDMKMLELRQGDEKSELNGIEPSKNFNLLDNIFEDAPVNQLLKNTSNTGLDKEESVRDISEESYNHYTHKERYEFEDRTDSQVGVSHKNTITIDQSKKTDEIKTNTQTNNLSKTCKPSEEDDDLLKADKHRVDGQLGGNSQRSGTTVDRIHLESWDGADKNSANREPNPLLAAWKAFVDAFVKFWSDE
ncbi:uncharacterized protein LOC106769722 isoform X2 [Vigna radiata var. radiata]|nr:uncharacterized protein LOC106769722 isoform X2 [Vigna radiata var. radiata]XP_014510939.1 uncharacterized protein LOC106769722 isoform X2 [Vigna radiata var. radiata]XP_014510940.1 uncharacterized protein LOC106769722 isoform X2 [Vigna radiata var. radiata]XP_014510942.1 uncharacterized protein LOC106769722 isoform X2 [Vigna radiata var. radiata]XP_022641106.1 uncharacterized protein LOC106769722 isoform X2 [Vigna radiata var. radiata]